MQVIFLIEDSFCFISDCGSSVNSNLKKLIKEQIIIFYSQPNALYSSDESVQIKHFILSIIISLSFFQTSQLSRFHHVSRGFTAFLTVSR